MRPAVQTAAAAMLVATLLCAALPAGLHAQTDEQPGDASWAPLAVCEDDEEEGDDEEFEPCEEYLDANIKSDADTVKWMLEQIKDRKTYAEQISTVYYGRDEIVQWIIVILSLLTTISAAITKLYPKLTMRGIDFAIAPIVLSSMIAAVTSINAYYQFDEYRRLSQNMAEDLTELEADIHFLVLRHVSSQGKDQVNQDTINDWHERLRTILQRYSQRESGNGV
jgi:uncharacterized membrane protein (DUF485 family)